MLTSLNLFCTWFEIKDFILRNIKRDKCIKIYSNRSHLNLLLLKWWRWECIQVPFFVHSRPNQDTYRNLHTQASLKNVTRLFIEVRKNFHFSGFNPYQLINMFFKLKKQQQKKQKNKTRTWMKYYSEYNGIGP